MGEYHTSAPYVNLGTATVLYSCLAPAVDNPLADLDSRPIREAQNEEWTIHRLFDMSAFGVLLPVGLQISLLHDGAFDAVVKWSVGWCWLAEMRVTPSFAEGAAG